MKVLGIEIKRVLVNPVPGLIEILDRNTHNTQKDTEEYLLEFEAAKRYRQHLIENWRPKYRIVIGKAKPFTPPILY